MVSNAREDLPLPLIPVITTSWLRGNVTSIFFRLCSRAPMTSICSCPILSRDLKALFINYGFAKDYKIEGAVVTAQRGKKFRDRSRTAIHGIFRTTFELLRLLPCLSGNKVTFIKLRPFSNLNLNPCA